jgi:hypothetical protein
VSFRDKVPAKHALTKGFSSVGEVNSLMALVWAWKARFGKSPGTDRVSSKASWADGIIRFEFSQADKRGWKKLDIDRYPFGIIKKAACDIGHAMTQAVDDVTRVRNTAAENRRQRMSVVTADERKNTVTKGGPPDEFLRQRASQHALTKGFSSVDIATS